MKRLMSIFVLLFFGFTGTCQKTAPLKIQIQELRTNTDASLRGLFVVNENVIWASGSAGTVLHSEDGGEHWIIHSIQHETANDFRSIYAWDENRALVFGVSGPSFGYLTTNGGESWQVVFQDTTKGLFFNSLKFADCENGLAVSDPVDGKMVIIRTEDGGLNWEKINSIPKAIKGEANFAASNTCIEYLPGGNAWIATGGTAARVFCSNNFGKSWRVENTPIISGKAASGIFSIAFKNDLEGVIVGGTYDKPELNQQIAAFTNNGGKTWVLAENMPKEYRSCVQPIKTKNTDFFFAVGKTGCDYSTDKGKNWQFVSDLGYYTFRSLAGKPGGFLAGNNGRIAKISFEY